MTVVDEAHPERDRRKVKKLLAVSATAMIVSAALAVPALALPTGTGVRAGHNIAVFHNLDFVAAFGYPEGPGRGLKVEVFSKAGALKGSAAGPTVVVEEGLPLNGALEVNHGPEGTPAPGDCWEGTVPDVRPGDRVVVTETVDGVETEFKDEVLVDNIRITQGPTNNRATRNDKTDVTVKGRASYADGAPIPIAKLDSGEVRQPEPRFRANPSRVIRTPGTTNGWTAIYKAPYEIFQIKEPLTLQQQKRAVLRGDHAMGYGHVAPLPLETQLVEGLGGGGPAPGCNGTPADV